MLDLDSIEYAMTVVGDYRDHLLQSVEQQIEWKTEDLAAETSDKAKERIQGKLDQLAAQKAELEGADFIPQIEPIFRVPDDVALEYETNTDVQRQISNQLFEFMGSEVGDEAVARHVFRLVVQGQTPRAKKATAKGGGANVQAQLNWRPLSTFKEIFAKAAAFRPA